MKKTILTIVGIIVILAAAAGLFLATHDTSNLPYTTDSSSNTTSSGSSNSSQQTTSGTDVVIQTKTDASLGQYLADGTGKPLYTYGGDRQGVSNCTDQCIASWPVYAATKTTGLPANVSIITRPGDSKQYAYKGLPLYTFSGDSPGQPTGDDISNFHLAKP